MDTAETREMQLPHRFDHITSPTGCSSVVWAKTTTIGPVRSVGMESLVGGSTGAINRISILSETSAGMQSR